MKTHGGDGAKQSEARVEGFWMNKIGTAAVRRQKWSGCPQGLEAANPGQQNRPGK